MRTDSDPAAPLSLPSQSNWVPQRWQKETLLVLIAAAFVWSLSGWFCGDDAVTLLDASRVVHDPLYGFGPGTFGRFRPLRLFSVAGVYAFFDTHRVRPYHLLSLAIHVLNMLLTLRLLRRLIGQRADPVISGVPFGATAVAAVHAAGSEAVTYLSAIGMLFSTAGTLLGCLAVRDLPKPRGFALLTLGMLIAIGGGYAMPTVLVVLLCALWPREDQPRRLLWKEAGLASLVVIPLTAVYAIIEKLLIVHDFEKQARFDPLFMLGQFIENIAHLCLPSTFVNEPIVYAMLILAAAAILAFKPLRETLFQPRVWLLLAITAAGLLPYAPSALGNRDRFCYLPAPFFAAFWLLIFAAAFRRWLPTPQAATRFMLAVLVVALAVNVAGMQVRVRNTNRCGESLHDFVQRVAAIKHDAHDRHLRVFMITPDLEQGLRMLELLGIIRYEDGILGMPLTTWPPPGEIRVIASYRKRQLFDTYVVKGEPLSTAPAASKSIKDTTTKNTKFTKTHEE
jgi:hypothetical protein